MQTTFEGIFQLLGVICVILWLSLVSYASLVDDILAALQNMGDCPSCLAVLVPLQSLALLGDEIFVESLTAVCDAKGTEDPDVCAGVIAGSGPIIAHDLRQISSTGQSASRLCDALFGLCSSKSANPFTVPLPPKSSKRVRPVNQIPHESKTFKVVHISDVHIDRQYTVGAEANCTKPICCRDFGNTTEASVPAGPNGNSKCDSPVSLADSLLDAVRNVGARFVIFTGDVVEGAVWLVNQSEVTRDLQDFDAQLASKLNIPVYPSLGNHDSAPVNAFQRNTTGNATQWVFDTQSAGWIQWIGHTASREVKHHSGSYSVRVHGMNLRILSVNTQYWYKQNFWLYDSDTFQPDPNGVLAFMVQQLQDAEEAGDLVWVIGHIPLGKEDTMDDQSNYYDQILQRYRDTIAGQFFGHSHKDQFEIAYSNYDEQTAENAVGVGLIAPALTPTSGNPAFKVYDVKPDTFEVMDVRVLFTNTSDPSFQIKPKWSEYYSARQIYGPLVGLPDTVPLTPAFWHNLTNVFEANDTAFQLFNTFLSRGGAVSACNVDCKNTTICDMRAFRSQNNCDTPSPGFAIRRRGIDTRHDSTECEGTRIGDIFMDIATKASSV